MSRTVSVLFGGPSPEHEISILTGLQCERVLSDVPGYTVLAVYWAPNGQFYRVRPGLEAKDFLDGVPSDSTPLELVLGAEPGFVERKRFGAKVLAVGTVLNCCHGGPGEAGELTATLELCGIASTGGPSSAAQLGMDKYLFGVFADSLGVPTLPRHLVTPDAPDLDVDGPLIVKPRFGGSSLGIEVVADFDTARNLARSSKALRGGAVVESFLADAYDLNIAYCSGDTVELSMIEKPEREVGTFYGYADKYLTGSGLAAAPRELPAQVPEDVAGRVHEWSRRLIEAGGFTGIGRIDFLYSESRGLLVNEINTIPGAMGLYLWPQSVSYQDLLVRALDSAKRRDWAAGIAPGGEALKVAGGIASKLNRPATS